MSNQTIENTIIISEAITQTLNEINEKLLNGEDVSELMTTLTNLTNNLNKKAERLNKKYSTTNKETEVTNNKVTKPEAKTETKNDNDLLNKIPKKYHEFIEDVSISWVWYNVKLKDGYVARNTQVVGDEYVDILADKNLQKIINNLKTIKQAN